MDCLERALRFYECPAIWRRVLRTNNVAERAMRRLRGGLRRAGRSPSNISGTIVILFASALSFNRQNP